ncbi:hypothetical protein PSCLAVI8L_160006 [Pseudoclavibacter sp. 8L]|nr:hypothetical protein PSCLAVI8L_160006 [Pseudoclavibacter sp. 8L]
MLFRGERLALPWRIRLVAYGARLESVLGESPQGFESPILRHVHESPDQGFQVGAFVFAAVVMPQSPRAFLAVCLLTDRFRAADAHPPHPPPEAASRAHPVDRSTFQTERCCIFPTSAKDVGASGAIRDGCGGAAGQSRTSRPAVRGREEGATRR